MPAQARSSEVGLSAQSWHARPWQDVLAELEAAQAGLSSDEALARRERFGPNQLPQQPGPTIWRILLRQFQNPLIYILLIAAVVSLAIGEWLDAGFIAAVLVLNAAIGGY